MFVVKIFESLQCILKPFVNDTRDIESKMKQLGNNFHGKIKNYLMIFSNMQHFFSFYRSYYFAELSFQFEEDWFQGSTWNKFEHNKMLIMSSGFPQKILLGNISFLTFSIEGFYFLWVYTQSRNLEMQMLNNKHYANIYKNFEIIAMVWKQLIWHFLTVLIILWKYE